MDDTTRFYVSSCATHTAHLDFKLELIFQVTKG